MDDVKSCLNCKAKPHCGVAMRSVEPLGNERYFICSPPHKQDERVEAVLQVVAGECLRYEREE